MIVNNGFDYFRNGLKIIVFPRTKLEIWSNFLIIGFNYLGGKNGWSICKA